MTTPSQAAFEIAMASSMEKHERGICQIAWREGIAHGRKQALEECLVLCQEQYRRGGFRQNFEIQGAIKETMK